MIYLCTFATAQEPRTNMAEEKKRIVAFLGPEGSYTHQVSQMIKAGQP